MGDESFDVVVSGLAFHDIAQDRERILAIREIVRVLKPEGRAAIFDFRHTREYVKALQEAGMKEVSRTGLHFEIFPPVRIVRAIKPFESA